MADEHRLAKLDIRAGTTVTLSPGVHPYSSWHPGDECRYARAVCLEPSARHSHRSGSNRHTGSFLSHSPLNGHGVSPSITFLRGRLREIPTTECPSSRVRKTSMANSFNREWPWTGVRCPRLEPPLQQPSWTFFFFFFLDTFLI
jgi:hypothetical protein